MVKATGRERSRQEEAMRPGAYPDLISLPAALPDETPSERAQARLEALILTGRLTAGTDVCLDGLAEATGIDGDPLLAGVQQLVRDGLLGLSGPDLLRVVGIDFDDAIQALEVRRVVEGLIIRDAALNATRRQREALAKLGSDFSRCAAVGDTVSFTNIDGAIDRTIAAASGNVAALRAVRPLQMHVRRAWLLANPFVDLLPMVERHLPLVRAVVAGDAAAAVEANGVLIDFIGAAIAAARR